MKTGIVKGKKHMRISHIFRLIMLACITFSPMTRVVESAIVKATAISAVEAGFVPLFNGRDLTGWEGDTRAIRHNILD